MSTKLTDAREGFKLPKRPQKQWERLNSFIFLEKLNFSLKLPHQKTNQPKDTSPEGFIIPNIYGRNDTNSIQTLLEND
jgi:hypothetical protein